MAIVYIGAGLANRMFQYSFALSLKNKGLNVLKDEHTFKPRYDFEDTKLDNVFTNINLSESTDNSFRMTLNESKVSKLYKRISEYIGTNRYIERWSLKFFPNIYNKATKHCIFIGFWLSYKYFEGIEDEIKQTFTFKDFSNPNNIHIADVIMKCNSVSVHFRKNIDYLKNNPGTCPAEYYMEAIKQIKKKVPNPKFYFFSDNWDWVRENIHGVDYTAIDWNSSNGADSYCDMQLMSLCKHNIIANSTYSWWAAWLNNNNSKIVITPSKWFPNLLTDLSDLIPSSWYIID